MAETEFEAALNQVAAEWNKAERAIKMAEQVNGEIVNPAIFELRYAGRRIIEALAKVQDEPLGALSLLNDAKFDCHRSQHDAIDAATSKMAGDLSVAVEYLSATVVLTHFPAFSELFGALNSTRERVAASREDRENRDKIYSTIQSTDLPRMVELYGQFRASENLMVQAAEQEEVDRKRNRAFGWGGLFFGALGVLVAIAVAAFSG